MVNHKSLVIVHPCFPGGSFYFSNFQFHSLIFSADPQIFIIFQQFLYVGISFFDFFDFLYLSILLLVLKKKNNYVCPDSSLESVKHIFKNNESGQTFFFF